MSTTIRKVDLFDEPRIRAILERLGFRFIPTENAYWRAKKGRATLTFFRSGAFTIQGKGSESLSELLLERDPKAGEDNLNLPERIGTDHAGSGDYFGPLTFAGVLVKKEIEPELIELGIRKPSDLTPSALKMLIAQIKFLCQHSTSTISPTKYNHAYERFGQIHRILGWGHAKVIEDILEKESCTHAISHQFAEEKFVREALMDKGKRITLIQRHHAEDNTAVAAASLLARESQKKALEELSTKYSIAFPRGASSDAVSAARAFVAKHGREALRKNSKLHFATTQQILESREVPEPRPEPASLEFTDAEILDFIANGHDPNP